MARLARKENLMRLGNLCALILLLGAAQGVGAVRIVFLGDSITDGNTYPLLVQQAMREAGKDVPIIINAGVASDVAAGMRKRLEGTVLARRPEVVTLSVGINDVLRKVPVEAFEADVEAMARRSDEAKVRLIIMTTSILEGKNAEADGRLEAYNAALRRVAGRRHLKVAEVNQLMRAARQKGEELLEADQVHPNFEGYRVMARALLDALGAPEVKVPAELKAHLLPGVIGEWKMRAKGAGEWKMVKAPVELKMEQWWFEQERKRGFVVGLEKIIGPAKVYEGRAVFVAGEGKRFYVNTGADLMEARVYGAEVYKNAGWTGWHAGKERIGVEMKKGENVIEIEAGSNFFLSVTEEEDWEGK
jgi:acyl-CoA thioesterase-1